MIETNVKVLLSYFVDGTELSQDQMQMLVDAQFVSFRPEVINGKKFNSFELTQAGRIALVSK